MLGVPAEILKDFGYFGAISCALLAIAQKAAVTWWLGWQDPFPEGEKPPTMRWVPILLILVALVAGVLGWHTYQERLAAERRAKEQEGQRREIPAMVVPPRNRP